MTFKEGEMCYSKKQTHQRRIGQVVEDALEEREIHTPLEKFKLERDYHKTQLEYYNAKIAHLEKMDKLYKEEYGI